jgi:hypothetical protein
MRAQARRTFDARFAMEGMVRALLGLLQEHPSHAAAYTRARAMNAMPRVGPGAVAAEQEEHTASAQN